MNLFKTFRPEIFQGNLKKKNYFEGWYFKQVSADLSNVVSLIPGISLNEKKPHAFIQYLNAISGESHYFPFPIESFNWENSKFKVEIGDNIFTEDHIKINLKNKQVELYGQLVFSKSVKIPSSFLSPGIMGWYSFIPFMECYHGIVSVNHETDGFLNINDTIHDFSAGKGYIEKDWGKSFPESWIWMQCNNFSEQGTSVMCSIAKIPWMGHYFIGFICFLYYRGKFHLFATYNGSKITKLTDESDKNIKIEFKNRQFQLNLDIVHFTSRDLKAPRLGTMERSIKESVDSEVEIQLTNMKNKEVYIDNGKRAGFEVVDSIFDYF